MGEPRPYRFHEDGEWYVCDVWKNPCGHIAKYNELLLATAADGGEGGIR